MNADVAVLFARHDSIYKTLPGCDVWGADRNALNWGGGVPVVAHPPCRGWGAMRQFSYADEAEKNLALWAVDQIRVYGGVLEHPSKSSLWVAKTLPKPGDQSDKYGGYTYPVYQQWFGHRAQKPTWLYIVGCSPADLPEIPFTLGRATHCIRPTKSYPRLPSVTKREREATPVDFARWLLEAARRCGRQQQRVAA